MRLSVDPSSRYYNAALIPETRVFVNGEPLDRVVEADEEEGWAKVHVSEIVYEHPIAGPLRTTHWRMHYGRVELR